MGLQLELSLSDRSFELLKAYSAIRGEKLSNSNIEPTINEVIEQGLLTAIKAACDKSFSPRNTRQQPITGRRQPLPERDHEFARQERRAYEDSSGISADLGDDDDTFESQSSGDNEEFFFTDDSGHRPLKRQRPPTKIKANVTPYRSDSQ